jgi:hypothetical protein
MFGGAGPGPEGRGGGPYRAHVPRPPDNRSTALQAVARRAVLLTRFPLAVLALAFFAPISHSESVASLWRKGPSWGLVVLWPMHFAALGLFCLLVVAGRRHRARPRVFAVHGRPPVPSRGARRAAYAFVCVASLGTALLLAYAWGVELRLSKLLTGWVQAAGVASVVGSLGSLALARWARGWQRWAFVVLAYAGAVSGIAALYVRAASTESVSWGVWLIVAATLVMQGLALVSVSTRVMLWRVRRARLRTPP